jgi:hypothetical protein
MIFDHDPVTDFYANKSRDEVLQRSKQIGDYFESRNAMIAAHNSKQTLKEDQMNIKTPNRFFIMYGDPFMAVEPVEALTRSKTVKSAMTRGDQFAVNMNSGALTIITKARMDACLAESSFRIDIKLGDDRVIRLDTETLQAFEISLETVVISETSANLMGALVFTNKAVTPVGFTRTTCVESFMAACKNLYTRTAIVTKRGTKGGF